VGTSYLQLESGVLVAQSGAGYATIKAALKQHDQNLELGQVAGVWKVYYRYGSEPHQVTFLADWRDPDGRPRELSYGLVDKVKSQDRNSREQVPDVDQLERRRQEELAKHRAALVEALNDEYRKPTISVSLPRTANRGNHRWKEVQLHAQKRRRAKGLDY